MQPDDPTAEEPIRARIVAAMAARMANADAFGTGPLAELRRLDPAGALAEPALHRLLARHRVPEGQLGGFELARWGLVAHACALAAPGNLAFPGRDKEPEAPDERASFWADEARRARRRLGRTLFEAGYSERRFANLLDAGSDDLPVALPRAVRFLVAGGARLPVLAVVDLVFSADENDDGWGRSVRQRMARGYYQAEFRAENPEGQAPQGDAA